MNRRFASCWALLLALVTPAGASAAASHVVATGTASGTVTAVSGSSFTIQTAGPRVGVVNALTLAASGITERDYPYVYGGGHAQAGIASIGIRGTGHNGRRVGFDCSGSVAAVLAGAGLWPAGSGVPNDAGIISTLRQGRLIAPGVGRGPVEVTLYDRPGAHIFMNIDGRFFGTSDGAGGGNPRGGAGWLDDGAPDASRAVYRAYHLLPSVVRSSTNAGHIASFQLGALTTPVALAPGDSVQVSYSETSAGSLLAFAITYPGSLITSGIVGSVAPDGTSFTVQTGSGQTLTLSVTNPALSQNLAVGDSVQVTYTTSAGTLTARLVSLTGSAAAAQATSGPANTGGLGGSDNGGSGWSGN